MRCELMMMTAVCVAAGSAAAGDRNVIRCVGFELMEVGDPGNRDTTGEETAWLGDPDGREMGGVDYVYRLSKYELTVEQHIEFVEAYYPFYVQAHGEGVAFVGFTGFGILAAFGDIGIHAGHFAEEPSTMNWEYLARYVNWLHNGKINESWAFKTGVYDTSTFTQNQDGSWNHQAAHDPHARFWIPTLDEWVKGGYWDPELNSGEGGYWRYPIRSDVEPIPGLLPEDGGQRNAGDGDAFPLAVGSFPYVASPWGLLDMAGGQYEYTETPTTPDRLHRRWQCGSWYRDDSYDSPILFDILGVINSVTLFNSFGTLRLATTPKHPADLNGDERLNYFDAAQFIRWFIAGDHRADFRLDGTLNIDDVRIFLSFYQS